MEGVLHNKNDDVLNIALLLLFFQGTASSPFSAVPKGSAEVRPIRSSILDIGLGVEDKRGLEQGHPNEAVP